MNTLDVAPLASGEYFFPGFRLLVDGEPIGELPGCVQGELSYWEFDGELLLADPETDLNDCYRIVGVCDCGNSGCGATWVRVTKNAGKVRFSEFSGCQEGQPAVELEFTEANYNEVMARMHAMSLRLRALHRYSSETDGPDTPIDPHAA